MIWGEVVNSLRTVHLGIIHEFKIDPKTFLKDVELADSAVFPFPEELDDFDEWDELVPVPELEDILPLHPVERVLLEGPILPIQKVSFRSKEEIEQLFRSIFLLERDWAKKVGILNPPIEKFLERACATQVLKLSTRLGFSRLGTV